MRIPRCGGGRTSTRRIVIHPTRFPCTACCMHPLYPPLRQRNARTRSRNPLHPPPHQKNAKQKKNTGEMLTIVLGLVGLRYRDRGRSPNESSQQQAQYHRQGDSGRHRGGSHRRINRGGVFGFLCCRLYILPLHDEFVHSHLQGPHQVSQIRIVARLHPHIPPEKKNKEGGGDE